MNRDIILQVKGLKTYFGTDDGIVKAVDGVSFDVARGETLGIVGESGCGKSVTNLSIMRLIPTPPGKIAGGEVLYDGKDILKMKVDDVRKIRGNNISMIFQDPMTSLNPFLRISTQLMESFRLHQGMNKAEAMDHSIEMLKLVGIPSPEKRVRDYPHQFSGGMRQRVMIAMALSCRPDVLVADEPTTALDVTIQAQIMELMKDLSRQFNTATILITHDLGVVAGFCDFICVMYAGKMIEEAPNELLFKDPKHPYTIGLLNSVPRFDSEDRSRLFSIEGQPPNLINLPECCPFYPRCDRVMEICKTRYPVAKELENNRKVSCWLYK
ncbi:MAG: ABC transporter ATP-binding protein [Desulfobacteraceae bacterium]|nr:ABC transporter ATP-binding protein [Desulfobacteraceae bacterium]